ncbi:MAG: 50S ribosomal protein L23 [Armatimonadetes bacterium]|nr:50S ribosomal protein L23 [Armatimonadota bacterium]
MKDPTQIILRPLITEKSVQLQRLNKFTFEVAMDATKVDIRRAIEVLGKCEVASVHTLIVKGKLRKTRRGQGRTPNWKKAIVTLPWNAEMGGLLGQAFDQV